MRRYDITSLVHMNDKYMSIYIILHVINSMDVLGILGGTLYNVYCNAPQFMCVYNTHDDTIIDVNPSIKSRTGDGDLLVEVIFSDQNYSKKYIKVDGIPCMLTVLSDLPNDGVKLMDMCPAHTKKWTQASDLVSLTDITSDGVWEWFPEVGFEYMSERFWNILGYDQKVMKESPESWKGFLNSDDNVAVTKMYEDHIESRGVVPYIARARYTRSDGDEVIVLCRGAVVDWMPNGKPWRILGTHTDITDIVKKDSVDAKSKFISRMSHEIRSPLCTILNECEMLGDGARTRVIKDTCRQLVSITDDILSIGEIKANSLELTSKCEDLSYVLSMCVKRHRIEAKKRNMNIRILKDYIPESVMMDLGKFNQILDNLIGNSLKYSDKGTILLDVEYDEGPCMCSIRITDEGMGMDPSFHTEAFQELVQGDTTMMGVGIGLTLCRRLSRLMGGDVIIERSSLGEGTTMLFTSHLPSCDDDDEEQEQERLVRSNSLGTSKFLKFRVLVVDDIKTNRDILKRRLETMKTMGMKITDVVDAVDGREAVTVFQREGGDFQLVLMDCHMPILDGFDATVQIHELCSKKGLEPVPVVAVTASVSTDIYDKCLSAGMKYVVTKPYSELDLMASIQSCIEGNDK